MKKKKAKQNPKIWLYLIGGLVVLVGALWIPVIQPMLRVSKAQHDVDELALGLKAYLITFGEFPSGSAAEICEALSGKNREHAPVVEAYEVNAAHEFIDPWGTPYRMSFEGNLKVYSCGPNKLDEQGKGDDIVAR